MTGELDTNGYYALGLPFYASVVVAELLVAKRRKRPRLRVCAHDQGNIAAGVGEVVLGLFLGPILLGLYDFGTEHLALVHWQTRSSPGSSPFSSAISAITSTTARAIPWPCSGPFTASRRRR